MARLFRKRPKKLSEVVGDYTMAASRRNDAPGNIRAGRFVSSSRTNVLTDEEAEQPAIEKTVRVIVRRPDGKFLCVYDPVEPDKVGLPGGQVEPGETEVDAALRELWEETGLKADSPQLVSVDLYLDHRVSLFIVESYDGALRSSHEGKVGWCSLETLASGFFGEYYSRVFHKLGYV